MPTPRAGYFLKDGTKVPSVTTILSRFKESGGLMQWAFKQGQSGAPHLYAEAEKAAAIGTVVHAMVEEHLKGSSLDESIALGKKMISEGESADALDKVMSAFNAYLAWHKNFDVEPVEQEIQLVSEKHRYGGTPDIIGNVGGKLSLLDVKTSSSVFGDFLLQLGGYALLWDENRKQKLNGGYHILRFSKENGDFSHHFFPSLDDEKRGFILMRELYDICAKAKKRAA